MTENAATGSAAAGRSGTEDAAEPVLVIPLPAGAGDVQVRGAKHIEAVKAVLGMPDAPAELRGLIVTAFAIGATYGASGIAVYTSGEGDI